MLPIILASQSPRRKQLLEWAEVPFSIVVRETDESFPPGLPVNEVPEYIAKGKARAVQQYLAATAPGAHDNTCILAADTVVVLEETVIGKPKDRNDAIRILSALSGQTHRVITGVTLVKGSQWLSFSDTTLVSFHPLSMQDIEYYIDQYKPYDKAGAYAIQEWIGVRGIRNIEGDFYNVMGLPVSRVIQSLRSFNK